MKQVPKLAFVSLLFVALFSCKKPVETLPDPAQEASLTRTVVLPNQGNLVKSAVYLGVSSVQPNAVVEGGKLNFTLHAHGSDRVGEGLLLAIDETNLQSGPVKTYLFSGSPEIVRIASYSYTGFRSDGSSWGSYTDTRFGVNFEGELTITDYDAMRRLISGRFKIKALNMINDPTRENTTSQVDPIHQCRLDLEGEFSHIKIR